MTRNGRRAAGRRAASLALVAAAVSCAPAPERAPAAARASAVIDGAAPASAGPVVALVRDGGLACSGVVIAPRVVLTAAHCVPAAPGDPGALVAVRGLATDAAAAERAPALYAKRDPAYDPLTLAHDVALVFVAGGLSVAPAALDGAAGALHVGAARVGAVGPSTLTLEAGPARACFGDSGGPVLTTRDGGARVVAVVSEGGAACEGAFVAARVDTSASFLASFVEATRPASVGPGGRCLADEACAAGACYAPPDAPSVRYCSAPCAGDGDCGAGLSCAPEGRCRHPPPSPGAPGTACATDDDCHAGACARPGPSAPPRCARPCLHESSFCGEAARCAADASAGGRLACFAEPAAVAPGGATPSGGCTQAPPAPSALAPGLVALALVAAGGRRRRRRRSTS